MLRAAVLLCIVVCGCKKTSEPESDGVIPSDAQPLYAPIDCPDDLYELGVAGTYAVDTADFTWGYDRRARVSYSPIFYARVADDTLSLSVTVEGDDATVGFLTLEIGGEMWVDVENDGYYGLPLYSDFDTTSTVVLPVNEVSYPAPGCLAVVLGADGNQTGDTGTVSFTTRRVINGPGTLDLNVIVIDGTELFDEEIDIAIERMNALYTAAGAPAIGIVDIYTAAHPNGAVLDEDSDDLDVLRSILTGDDPRAMNLFFIDDFVEPGTLGLAAGIPGPIGLAGTAGSGVILSVASHLDGSGQTLDAELMGETMAHEVGHQLGLFHTTESEGGSYDVIADTPQCPESADDGDGELSAEECADFDGRNFMFWAAGSFSQDQVSPIQAAVLFDSPIVQ